MQTTPAVFIQTKYLEDAETEQYACPNNAIGVSIDEFTLANQSGSAASVVVRVVPAGATPGPEHELQPAITLDAGEVYPILPLRLAPGDTIRTNPSAASAIVARASGRIYT